MQSAKENNDISVDNAGLALLTPFIPRLFDATEVLGKNAEGVTRIIGAENAARAVNLLQYLVDGQGSAPTSGLALNKLMCGLHPDAPIGPFVELSLVERKFCDELLLTVLANWTVLNNSSIPALRENFLQRKGHLTPQRGTWAMTVQRKQFDALLDTLPWYIATISFSWMLPHTVAVDW